MYTANLSRTKEASTMHTLHMQGGAMNKDMLSSGESRAILIVNKKPVNPRTFEKLIVEAKIVPIYVSTTTGTRFFKKSDIEKLAKKIPKTLKRGQKLKLK